MKNKLNLKGIWFPIYILILILNVTLLMPPSRKFFIDIGWRWVYMLLISFGISFCLTPLCELIAHHGNILDKPDTRKLHLEATPLLGGAAVFTAFLAAILINGIYTLKLYIILVSASVLFVVGMMDDLREIPAWIRLASQILCAGLVMSFGIILRVIPENFGLFSIAGNVFLTVLWIIGITNAMNFFDGMDGLAAGVSGLIAFFLGTVAFQTGQPFLAWISVALMGGCLGFLPFNFRIKARASIFLGDAGSTVLGFLLACVAVYGKWAESDPVVALASPLLIFWILIFDMVHITIDRIITGKVANFREWIDYVGKDHLHHRLANVLGGHKRSVLFIYLLILCLGTSAIVLRYARPMDAILLIIQAFIIVGLITILERRGRAMANTREDSEI
ncbi:glycosyltransferase family 4 protein [Thermodesulfobacteriota bacterium]